MTTEELKKYIDNNVFKQGSASAKILAPLLNAITDKLNESNDGLVETSPILIEKEAVQTETNSTMYNVTNEQQEINSVIRIVNENNHNARIVVSDNKLTILFSIIEYANDSVTAITPAHDGYYYLHLSTENNSSYLNHYSFIEAISPVTEAEIEVYSKLFNATYDKQSNKFQVLVGSTLYKLSPADMLLADQEYDKVANTTNYTAMWANSKSKYIKCHEWFNGFSTDIDLHSTFYGCKETEAIDLNVDDELVVSNLTNAFANCESLQEVTGIIALPESGYSVFGAFNKCIKLHSIKLKNLGLDVSFMHSPQITAESIKYIIDNAKPNTAFTITLNPTVLEKYNSSQDWAYVRSSVEQNGKIKIA